MMTPAETAAKKYAKEEAIEWTNLYRLAAKAFKMEMSKEPVSLSHWGMFE